MMNKQKTFVYTLIFLLTVTGTLCLYTPAQAETWTDITLPYTITQGGNYRITAPFVSSSVDVEGLIVNASNVVVDGQNYRLNVTYSLQGAAAAVKVLGQSNVVLKNLNITGGYYGLRVENSSVVTVENCTATHTYDAGIFFNKSSGFDIKGCTFKELWTGVFVNSSTNFNILSTNILSTDQSNGITVFYSANFTLSNNSVSSASYNGISAYLSDDYLVENSTVRGSIMQGLWGGYGKNITVTNCSFEKNAINGIYIYNATDTHLTHNTITNNSQGTNVYYSNVTFSDNFVAQNRVEGDSYWGGFQSSDSNCTVTKNVFDHNYDALMWETHEDYNTTYSISDNVFQNNDYTFFFDYSPKTVASNQKIVFSNNLVNDTAYIDPVGLNEFTNASFTSKSISLNGTVQFGRRLISNGPYISGNYWAHPNGQGPSQTGADLDKDGFIDAAFELFGNAAVGAAYDYHPYSSKFDVNQWVNITLPAAIYSPGHYRIMSSYTGAGIALQVSASNVTVDGQYFTAANATETIAVYVKEGSNILIENMTVQNAYVGFLVRGSNTTLRNINTNATIAGIYLEDASNVNMLNCSTTNSLSAIVVGYCNNVNVTGSRIHDVKGDGVGAVYVMSSNNTIFENIVCNGTTDGSGIFMYDSNNLQVKSCNLTNNFPDGITINRCSNISVTDCNLNGNGWSSELFIANNGVFRGCQMSNNSQGIYAKLVNNLTFTGNTISYNGLNNGTYTGGFEAAESNCTVTNNIFDSNYDAYIWQATYSNTTCSQQVYGNIFRNNKYTFFFIDQLPSTYTQQKLIFYNNFVNDSAYVDPVCFNGTYSAGYLPFNSSIFAFNTTLQAGIRIYSNGPNIGGNFWANPAGSGPSQTGADADHDGFIDARFELLNNATNGAIYDNLPLSAAYATPTPTPTSTPAPTVTPSPTQTPTSTPTSTPTATPTQTPTTTPTTMPTTTPQTTHSTEETPWLLIVAVIVAVALIGAVVFMVSKRKHKPT